MHVQLKKPELQKFIDDQVKAGHFSSPEAAVEAAVEQMMLYQAACTTSVVADGAGTASP